MVSGDKRGSSMPPGIGITEATVSKFADDMTPTMKNALEIIAAQGWTSDVQWYITPNQSKTTFCVLLRFQGPDIPEFDQRMQSVVSTIRPPVTARINELVCSMAANPINS